MMRNVARGIVLAIAGAISMTACVVEQVPDHDRVEHVDGQEPLVPVVVVEQWVPMTRGVQTCGWLALSHPIDKFMGDAVMAVFKGESHIGNAIGASLAVHKAIEAQKETLSDEKTFLPKVSIGINSGEMISGNIGSMALKRLDFTVRGDVVNTIPTIAICSKTRPNHYHQGDI